jgi:hypothetical protein
MYKKLLGTTAIALVIGMGAAACGTSGSGPGTDRTASPASPSTVPAPSPETTTPTDGGASSPTPAPVQPQQPSRPSSASVPAYQPSSVVSQSPNHTQLKSVDPVAKVTSFYDGFFNRDGWTIVSSNKTAYSANVVAKRSGQGATIAIASAGPAGTSVSISTYPS